MPPITIEFEYSFGDFVRFTQLDEKIIGMVISLWVSDRGIKYEVSYCMDGSFTSDYFFSQQLQPYKGEGFSGFRSEK